MKTRTHRPGHQNTTRASERPAPRRFSAHPTGRQAIRRALAPYGVQYKLTVGEPGDVYEREADRVADQVMRMPNNQLQRACACGGSCAACQRTSSQETAPRIQRRVADGGAAVEAPPIIDAVLRSPGRPLDDATRAFMEPRFGRDLGHVRVHVDRHAEDASESVHARAFTVGRDIAFARGQYQPSTSAGKALIAHELTHVFQQGSSATRVQRTGGKKKNKLDPVRVKYANEELWARHPELKMRALTMDKADDELRKEWWRYYQWGKDKLSRGNCYRYSVDDPMEPGKGQAHSPFPGGPDPGGHITCKQIMDGAKKMGAVDATHDKPCPKGSRKIAGVIQDKSAIGWNDYHWYRLESNGLWTHKRGRTEVQHKDASGKPITDPSKANRNYPGNPDYDKFCGYLCISKTVDIDKGP